MQDSTTAKSGRAQRMGVICLAAIGLAGLSGCGTVGLFGEYDLPESPEVAAAPWPRLVDVPAAPAVGSYTADVPDPAVGRRTLEELGVEASVASARAEALAGPVLSEADRAALLGRAEAARRR